MNDSHVVTFTVDRSRLFDALQAMGGDTGPLGTRLVSALLGDGGMINAIGLAAYGIEIAPVSAALADASPDIGKEGIGNDVR